jgi:hypothetical protein
MALHHQLPIHKTGSQLLGLAARIHAQMRRGYKRSVGEKIVGHCSEMLDLMALANATKNAQRAAHISEILTHNRAATTWLRVAFDLKEVSPQLWAESVQMLDNIGRQASGWKNKTLQSTGKAPAA